MSTFDKLMVYFTGMLIKARVYNIFPKHNTYFQLGLVFSNMDLTYMGYLVVPSYTNSLIKMRIEHILNLCRTFEALYP